MVVHKRNAIAILGVHLNPLTLSRVFTIETTAGVSWETEAFSLLTHESYIHEMECLTDCPLAG